MARASILIPGLWDMHAHYEQVEWGPIYLAAGVTTVRDCGNEFDFITTVRDTIVSGRGIGPEILVAGIVDGSRSDLARRCDCRYARAGDRDREEIQSRRAHCRSRSTAV